MNRMDDVLCSQNVFHGETLDTVWPTMSAVEKEHVAKETAASSFDIFIPFACRVLTDNLSI
jgi:hypothetical protein